MGLPPGPGSNRYVGRGTAPAKPNNVETIGFASGRARRRSPWTIYLMSETGNRGRMQTCIGGAITARDRLEVCCLTPLQSELQ